MRLTTTSKRVTFAEKNIKIMVKKFIYAACALALLFFVSCSEDSLETITDNTNKTEISYKVTPEEARNIVQEFVDEMETNLQTRNSVKEQRKEIANIDVLRSNFIKTRAEENNIPIDLDTLIYVVNFSNNNGFVLVAADKRTEPIFAVVDEGNFQFEQCQKEENDMFLTFLDNAIYTELEDIKKFDNESQTRATSKGWTINTKYSPILKTKWSQGGQNSPNSYGKYCPNKTTGCTVTATAQILSHFKTPSHVSWSYNGSGGSSDLHWTQILSDCEKYNGYLSENNTPQSLNEVAHLCRYLGNAFGADYKSNGSTGVKEGKPIDWFNDWSGLKATKLKDYNESQIISAVKSGNPVYARGNSGRKKFLGITVKYTGGHAWVYDGYISATKDEKQQNLIHCNWGWGGSRNGYYLSKVFNTPSGAEINDNEVTRGGTANYYKYNLEYSIISK